MTIAPANNDTLAEQLHLAAMHARDGARTTAIGTAINAIFGVAAPVNAYALGVLCSERVHQVNDLGYDAAHDDQHPSGELAVAAALYALPIDMIDENLLNPFVEGDPTIGNMIERVGCIEDWNIVARRVGMDHAEPIDDESDQGIRERISDLSKAGALILAELERQFRLLQGGAA